MKYLLLFSISLSFFSCNNRVEQQKMNDQMAEIEQIMAEMELDIPEKMETEDFDYESANSSIYDVLNKSSKSKFYLEMDLPVEFETENCTVEQTKKGYIISTTNADTCSVKIFYNEEDYYGDSKRILYDERTYLLK